MKSVSKEPAQIRLTVHLRPPETSSREQLETELVTMRTELRNWLLSIDPSATVIPDRNVPSACSIAYITTSSYMAAFKAVLLPFTWRSLARKVEMTKENRPLGVGDVIEPLRK